MTVVSTGPRPRVTRGRGLSRQRKRQAIAAWGFSLPFVLIFGVFMLVPLVSSVVFSFTDMTSLDIRHPGNVQFVGFSQYLTVLQDAQFRRALLNTGYFVLVGLPLTMAVAMGLAVLLDRAIGPGRTFFRVAFYTPVVTSVVAVSVVWRFILQPDGLLNSFLGVFGITGRDWLHDEVWAMPSLILMAVWRNMGTLMIIFLAGLQNIPAEVDEAAMMDGASAWQRFTRITLPLMRPTLLLGAVMTSVGYLQFFEEPFVMTQGGPLGSTLSITYYTFNQFGYGDYGLASAASYLLFALIALLSAFQFRLLRSKD